MRGRHMERKPARLTMTAALAVGIVLILGHQSHSISAAAVVPVNSSIDFSSPAGRTDPAALGMVSSTYGATPLSSSVQANAERQLDARFVRIPVGYRNGRVTSSAGGSGPLDVPALVSTYHSWGYRVLVVIGGTTNDVDLKPGDATRIMKALGFVGIEYSAPNEPGNQGLTLQDQIKLANMIVEEGRALVPNFKLWGPVWPYYDRSQLGTFASAMGSALGGVDFHHYAMGSSSMSTAQAMSQTPSYGQQVQELSSDLAARGTPVPVNVDELNFSWRYNDGTLGGNNRFFTAVNTVWMTSALGHILQAGGRGMPYATQNGPLGIMVQSGQVNPDNRPASSPMPAYWAIANWTGGKIWPHYKDTFYAATSNDTNLEPFAVNNEAGGYSLLLVNKSESSTKSLSLTLSGIRAGTYAAYQNNVAAPYAPPVKVADQSYNATTATTFTLPPMTVTVLVLTPSTSTSNASVPGIPTNAAATTSGDRTASTIAWQPPASTGGSPITSYRVSRDGSDSSGGGTYSTIVSSASRSFTFTLLKPTASYQFSVQAINAIGAGPAWSSGSAPPTTSVAQSTPSQELGAPTRFQATGSEDPSKVTVTWQPPTTTGGLAVSGYRVGRDGSDATGGGAYATNVATANRSFTFSLLTRHTGYRFWVEAISAGTTGPQANTTFITQ